MPFSERLRGRLNCHAIKLRNKIAPCVEKIGYTVTITGNEVPFVISNALICLVVLAYYAFSVRSFFFGGADWLAYMLNLLIHTKIAIMMYIDCNVVQKTLSEKMSQLRIPHNQWNIVLSHFSFLKFIETIYVSSCAIFTGYYILLAVAVAYFPSLIAVAEGKFRVVASISLVCVAAYDIATCVANLFGVERISILK